MAWHRFDRVPASDDDRALLEDFGADQRARGLALTTITNRDSILRAFAAHAGKPLLEMDLRDLRAYLGRDDLSNATRNTIRSALRALYQFALAEGLLDVDPSERLGAIRVPRGEPRPFTQGQIAAMLNGAYSRTQAMILLGYYQGLRVSSIARMHGADVDLDSGLISVTAKGDKIARLPLHPVIREIATRMPADNWWFPARRGAGGHIDGASVTDLVRRAKLRAGITDPRLTAHSLRHSFGSHLVEAGVDIVVIQKLMMHEDLSTTQIYAEVSERRKRDGIVLLAGVDLPERSDRRPVERVVGGAHGTRQRYAAGCRCEPCRADHAARAARWRANAAARPGDALAEGS